MNQFNENIQITLLYSIATDYAQDFQLDKINFHDKNIQECIIQETDSQIFKIKGFFGEQKQIEREIKSELKREVELTQILKQSDKGNLIVIKFQKIMLYCLILPTKFLTTRPIQEKSIEIVLFRILHDFTDNIKLCLDKAVFTNWYSGNDVPFCPQNLEREDYDFTEASNKKTQIYQCGYLQFNNDISHFKIIKSQSMLPQIYLIERLKMNKSDYFDFNSFTESLMIQIITTQNHNIIPLINSFKKVNQEDKLKDILNDMSNKLNKEITQQIQFLTKNIIKELKPSSSDLNIFQKGLNFFQELFTPNDQYYKQAVQIVTQTLQTVNLTQPDQFSFLQENVKYKQVFLEYLGKINRKTKEIKQQYENKIKQFVQELSQQSKYSVKKVDLKIFRSNDSKDEQILNIRSQFDEDQLFCLDGSFLQNRSLTFEIKEIFSTNKKATIFIVQTETMSYILFLQFQASQVKVIRQQDLKEIKKSVYYYDYNLSYLYIFNHRDKYVQSIMISPLGVIQNEQFFCYQFDNKSNSFLVDQVAYLNVCKKFIVMSKNNKIYIQSERDQKFQILKCLVEFDKKIKETEFTPSIKANDNYKQLLTCPSGKYFYLANYYCCDRYDFTGKRLQTIIIKGEIKIFSDSSDVIIFDQYNEQQFKQEKKFYVISNLISQKKFQKQQKDKMQNIGNSALDIVKGSFIKFGPNAEFLYKQKQRKIDLYVEPYRYDQIEQYFKNLNLNNVSLSMSNQEIKFSEINSNQMMNIIFSRVPLQLCTIENGILIPLHNGFRQLSQVQKNITVDSKVKQLHLGFLEDYLQAEDKNIFVVGIIGKQSSGKSYLLNRVFGTRFSVSSARCTDGVWGSLAYVNDKKFLILDCEGLFNGGRTEKDEIKMLAFVTAISDITILNSDSTFSRYQNELFNNLVEASKQLNDKKLFLGFLYIIIRDVSMNDNNGVDQELFKNLERLKQAGSQDIIFLDKLFNNQMSVQKLVNYENSLFDEQLKNVRSFISRKSMETNRWKNGKELIQMAKIVLCQLELSDTKNASLIDFQIKLEQIYFQSKAQWYQFSLPCEDLKLIQKNYQFEIEDEDYIMSNNALLKILYDDLKLNDTIDNHKQNLQEANNQLNKLMNQRKERIMQNTQSQISDINGLEIQQQIQQEDSKLQDFFKNQVDKYQFCQSKCNECYLSCKQFKNHIEYSKKLKAKLESQISNLEQLRESSSIKDSQEEEIERNKIKSIQQNIEEIENNLKGLKNLIKLKNIQETISKLMNEINDINLKFGNQNIQITFGLDYIDHQQKETEKMLKKQLDQQDQNNKNIKQIKDEQLNIEKKKNANQKEIDEHKSLFQQILRVIYQTTNFGIQDEDNTKQLQSKLQVLKNQQLELEEESNYLQSNQDENQKDLVNFDKMSQQEFIQRFQFLSKEKKELTDKIQQIKQKKKDLKDQETKIQDINQEIIDYEKQSKYKFKREIENLNKKLQDLNPIYIDKQLYQFEEEEKIKRKLKDNKFSNVECFEKVVKEKNYQINQQEQQSQLINLDQNDSIQLNEQIFQQEIQEEKQQLKDKGISEIKSLFLSKKKQKSEKDQDKILQLQKQIIRENKEIEQFPEIIDKQQQQFKLVNKQIEINQKLSGINEKLKTQQKEQNLLQEQLDNLKNKEQDIINQNQKIEQSISQLRNLQEHLMKIKTQDKKKKEFESLLKDWKGREEYSNRSVKDLDQVKTSMEQRRQCLQNQLEEKNKSLEIYNKVEADAGLLISLKQKLEELEKLNLNVHSCQRQNHKCDQSCKICPDKTCDNKAGHDMEQEHLCSLKNHKCNHLCEITLCKQKCNLELNHSNQHNCTNDHPCLEQCQYCNRNCNKNRSTPHSIHQCEETQCLKNCILCGNRCKELHAHSQYCNQKCEEQHQHSRQWSNHFCGDQHECKELCQVKGVCYIKYDKVEHMWQSKFSYIKYSPQGNEKKKCCINIKPGQLEHELKHSCMIETEKQFHTCDQKCPECNTYCDLKYGHSGFHSSQVHINKESQIFTVKEGEEGEEGNIEIADQDNSIFRQYKIGDKSTPETCDQSCKRRGKSHYHLIECKGESECLEKQLNIKAKHSKEKYVGFSHLDFDEVLCLDFWKLKGWAHPVPNEMDNIGQCNYYCPLCKKINEEYQFCSQEAWHTLDNKLCSHSFPCALTHREKFIQGIKISFVIDTTGSMEIYIKSCKMIIKNIIQKTKQHKTFEKKNADIQFAIVSYKDHFAPYNENEQVVDVCEFTSDDNAISFLDKLSATGGYDIPEAVMDGLFASSQLNWSGNYQNILYLICDSPPHGIQYHNFSDNFPDGCPCQKQQSQILANLINAEVQLKIMKLNQNLEGMITQFKNDYPELIVLTPEDQDEITFQNLIIGDVCQHLRQYEITY